MRWAPRPPARAWSRGGNGLRAVLRSVAPTDPVVLGGAAPLLLATAAGASLVPTRRALAVDPATTLREEQRT